MNPILNRPIPIHHPVPIHQQFTDLIPNFAITPESYLGLLEFRTILYTRITHTHTHTHTHAHAHTHTYAHTRRHIQTHTYMNTHTHIYINTYAHTKIEHTLHTGIQCTESYTLEYFFLLTGRSPEDTCYLSLPLPLCLSVSVCLSLFPEHWQSTMFQIVFKQDPQPCLLVAKYALSC